VVVTDVMMPWMDGYDLLTAIRKDDELADVPVILLTARGELDARIEGLTRGADAYLAKPFEPLELAVQIDALLAQRLRLRERLLARIASAQLVVVDDSMPTINDVAPKLSIEARRFRARLDAAIDAQLSEPDFGVAQLASAVAMERTGLYKHCADLL